MSNNNLPADDLARLEKLTGKKDHPEHYCHRCGGRNMYSWSLDNDTWNEIVESHPDIAEWRGIICPSCLCELDRDKYGDYSIWYISKTDPRDQQATIKSQAEKIRGMEKGLDPTFVDCTIDTYRHALKKRNDTIEAQDEKIRKLEKKNEQLITLEKNTYQNFSNACDNSTNLQVTIEKYKVVANYAVHPVSCKNKINCVCGLTQAIADLKTEGE